MNNSTKICKFVLLFVVAVVAGCYQQPSADKIQFDVDAVEELRSQVKTMDWE